MIGSTGHDPHNVKPPLPVRMTPLFLLALVSTASTAVAQASRVDIQYTLRNNACPLALQRVTVIGGHQRLLLDPSVRLGRDSRGRYLANAFGRQEVAVFDSTGRLVGSFGNSGEGPGEFRAIADVLVGPHDSLYVVNVRRKIEVFAPELTYVRTVNLPGNFIRGVVLENSQLVTNMPIPRSGAADKYAVHVLSPQGDVEGSIDPAAPPTSPHSISVRSIARGADGQSVWTASPEVAAYVLSRWSIAGERPLTVTVAGSPWFVDKGQESDRAGILRLKPRTTLEPAFETTGGRLVVLLHVADVRWRQVAERGFSGKLPTASVMDEMLDTIVEVLDLSAHNVVASQRFDSVLHPLAGTDHLWSASQDSVDVVSVNVWNVNAGACAPTVDR